MNQPVQRIQGNLLAKQERRLLNWLCARLPDAATPDRMTILGFAGSLLSSLGYVLSNFSPIWLWVAIIGYFINWFGDSLDGSLARYRKIERPNYGYFIDHSLDALANTILLFAIGLSPYMRMDIAMIALVGYLLLSIHTFISAKVMGEFRLSYGAGGPTELRIMLIIMSICMYYLGPDISFHEGFSAFDDFAIFVACIMVPLFIFQTASNGRHLFKLGK